MIAKYVIVYDQGFETPVIFSELLNHSQSVHGGLKIVSAGKLVWNENDLSVAMGSVSLGIERNPERQGKDLELIQNFINKFYY